MTFYIFMPEDDVNLMRRDRPYPALYFLAGLTCTCENAPFKSGFAQFAKKRNIAMVFPDTSPRGVDETCPGAGVDDYRIGYGAGHYVNATQDPWSKHFNMYSYVTEELPALVEKYFFIDPERKSVTGFSMGGGGALMVAAKNPGMYKSVTAFAPICSPSTTEGLCSVAYEAYFGDKSVTEYDAVALLTEDETLSLPPGFVDVGSVDAFMKKLQIEKL